MKVPPPLARPNHQFEKRRRELAKQQKKEEKRLRKLEKDPDAPEGDVSGVDDGAEHDTEGATEPVEPVEAAEIPESTEA